MCVLKLHNESFTVDFSKQIVAIVQTVKTQLVSREAWRQVELIGSAGFGDQEARRLSLTTDSLRAATGQRCPARVTAFGWEIRPGPAQFWQLANSRPCLPERFNPAATNKPFAAAA